MIMNFKPPNHLEVYQQNFTVVFKPMQSIAHQFSSPTWFPFQLGFVLTELVTMKGSHTWAGRLVLSWMWEAGVPGPPCAQRS